MYAKNKDKRDTYRELKSRGDTHSLEGGETIKGMTKRFQKKIAANKLGVAKAVAKDIYLRADNMFLGALPGGSPSILKVWQDRNRSNNGTKLNP
jgi:hypothetical protein